MHHRIEKHFDDVLSKTEKDKETEQDNTLNKIIRPDMLGLTIQENTSHKVT